MDSVYTTLLLINFEQNVYDKRVISCIRDE